MARLKAQGKAILFISHKFDEVYEIADNYAVFRDGHAVGHGTLADTRQNDIVRMMVGRSVDQAFPKQDVAIGKPVLKVENYSHPTEFRDISFELRKGKYSAFTALSALDVRNSHNRCSASPSHPVAA